MKIGERISAREIEALARDFARQVVLHNIDVNNGSSAEHARAYFEVLDQYLKELSSQNEKRTEPPRSKSGRSQHRQVR